MARRSLTQEEIAKFRDDFCQKAYELYQQKDFHAISMRGIAKAMACSPMLAYRYFENKDDVFASLRATLFHRLADALEAVPVASEKVPVASEKIPVASEKIPGAINYLKGIGVAYATFADKEPHAYRLLYLMQLNQNSDYPEVASAQKRTQLVLFKAISRAIETGEIDGDVIVTAHMLWAMIHGLVSLDLSNQLNQGASFAELFPQMLAQFINNSKT